MGFDRKRLYHLYFVEKKSTRQVAKELGVGQSTVRRWMEKYGLIARNLSESRLKHLRRPFSGDIVEKTYLVGLCAGDISALKRTPFTIEVTTATTHPAMINLFYDVFRKYGHCVKYPRKSNLNYEWGLLCALDLSFAFLLNKNVMVPEEDKLFYSFLAGYSDAEGCWAITPSHGVRIYFRFILCTGDSKILKQIKEKLEAKGYHPSFRQVNIEKKTKYKSQKLKHTKKLYELCIHRKKEVATLIKNLLLFSKHKEKIGKMNLILRIMNKKYWREVESEIKMFKEAIKKGTDGCINQARLEYELRKIEFGKSTNHFTRDYRNFNANKRFR
jgi:SOS-response transcriptional repressor LexA